MAGAGLRPEVHHARPDSEARLGWPRASMVRQRRDTGLTLSRSAVHAFNQRDIAGILAMIRTLGALVGVSEKAEALAQHYERRLTEVAAGVPNHPRPR